METRASVKVRGIVQGVGFRPFIHRLVGRRSLLGWVRNTSDGAEMEVEGGRGEIESFVAAISAEAPPLAMIESVEAEFLPDEAGYSDFRIIGSEKGAAMRTLVSPDMGICPDCLRELLDRGDRRYRYPFINCTNCGPRFTIIKSVPYDRAATSMAAFEMCPDCAREFEDISDRRYHAQPDCCAVCGPHVSLLSGDGDELPGDAIEGARRALLAGRIVCVKGLGGMHLACLAENEAACAELRRRKQRDERPLAVMCRDIGCAGKLCRVSPEEERLLASPRRPIVLLEKRVRGGLGHLSENGSLGVMLPYTPLHVLLMGDDIDCLVMTSANLSDTPIIYKNSEAIERLRGIADLFLLHDREIVTRCDDSLFRIYAGREYPLRRSRGYVPYPVTVPGLPGGLLACGAEQKASFCLSKPGYAFPSQHIGDLKNAETLAAYEGQIAHFERLFGVQPEALACALHPEGCRIKLVYRVLLYLFIRQKGSRGPHDKIGKYEQQQAENFMPPEKSYHSLLLSDFAFVRKNGEELTCRFLSRPYCIIKSKGLQLFFHTSCVLPFFRVFRSRPALRLKPEGLLHILSYIRQKACCHSYQTLRRSVYENRRSEAGFRRSFRKYEEENVPKLCDIELMRRTHTYRLRIPDAQNAAPHAASS